MVGIKTEQEIIKASDSIPLRDGIVTPEKTVSEQFRKLFISYSQAINKQENRTGSLFQKNFKRKEIKKESYFTWLVFYIHSNPVKAKLSKTFSSWKFSSYNALLSQNATMVMRKKGKRLVWLQTEVHRFSQIKCN